MAPRPCQDRLDRRVEADDDPLARQGLQHPRLDDQAAAAGHDHLLRGMPILDEPALLLPERGLAVLGKDPGDRLARLPLDLMVAVHALEAYPVGDGAPD